MNQTASPVKRKSEKNGKKKIPRTEARRRGFIANRIIPRE